MLSETQPATGVGQGCSALSLDAGEPLAGTAPALRRLVAVEHVGAWPPRVAAHPDRAVSGLAARLREQDATLLLIRRPGRRRRRTAGRAVLVADLSPGATRVVRRHVRGPDDLDDLTFDMDVGRPVSDPLLLVCAHGRRDVCCAVRGRALAAAVAGADPDHPGGVWECSHLGGHRFAPTAIALPTGYAYGRLDPATAVDVRKGAGLGEVVPSCCRGHVGRTPAEQVAELSVREHTGIRDADALTVDPADGPGDAVVRARDGRRWTVTLSVDPDAGARPASCGAALEPAMPLVGSLPARPRDRPAGARRASPPVTGWDPCPTPSDPPRPRPIRSRPPPSWPRIRPSSPPGRAAPTCWSRTPRLPTIRPAASPRATLDAVAGAGLLSVTVPVDEGGHGGAPGRRPRPSSCWPGRAGRPGSSGPSTGRRSRCPAAGRRAGGRGVPRGPGRRRAPSGYGHGRDGRRDRRRAPAPARAAAAVTAEPDGDRLAAARPQRLVHRLGPGRPGDDRRPRRPTTGSCSCWSRPDPRRASRPGTRCRCR